MASTCLLFKATTSASPFQLRSVAAGHRRRRSPIITSGLVAHKPRSPRVPRVVGSLLKNEHARRHGRRQLCRRRRRRLPASGAAAGEARTAEAATCGLIMLQGEGSIQWLQNALPPLTAESIAREVDFILAKGWVPCLEFDKAGEIHRSNSRMPGYYDGRYWTLWKLPMFGCAGAGEVLRELEECRREYPDAYIRLIAFDSSRQCQCTSFVVHKPAHAPPAAASPAASN